MRQCRRSATLARQHRQPALICSALQCTDRKPAWNVIRFRRGLDGRSLPPIRIPGEKGWDRNVLIGVATAVLRKSTPEKKVAATFVDSTFGTPIVERLRMLGFDHVHEVSFGGPVASTLTPTGGRICGDR
jgi:hypothetical protein